MTYSNISYTDPHLRGREPRHQSSAFYSSQSGRYTHASARRRAARRPRQQTLFAPRRRMRPSLILALLVVCGLGAACWFSLSSLASVLDGGKAAAAGASGPQSTPAAEWKAGDVPFLYQRDPAWASAHYAEDDFSETGCGPTCLAMVYIALTGNGDKTPVDIGALSEEMGCASPEGTAWLFMTDGAARLGMSAQEIPASEASIRQALGSGSPIICSMGPGDFTKTGHFIVLVGIDEAGKLIIRDPNSPERSAQTWDFETVISQARAFWAYSA